MAYPNYAPQPGQCNLVVPVVGPGTRRFRVLEISGLRAVLDTSDGFQAEERVNVDLELEEGPCLELSGIVVDTTPVTLQWVHSLGRDAGWLDRVLGFLRPKVAEPQETERGQAGGEDSNRETHVALLERKIRRLARSLDRAAVERDRACMRMRQLEQKGFVLPGRAPCTGIDNDDPRREQKLALLRELVAENRFLRKATAESHARS